MSIFAWRAVPETRQEYTGLLARSPTDFKDSSMMFPAPPLFLHEMIPFSISNHVVQFDSPLQTDESTGYTILPILHSDLPPDIPKSELQVNKRRVSYGVYLRLVGSSYVRGQPDRFAGYIMLPRHTNKSASFRASKWLSVTESDAVSRRVLSVRVPRDLRLPGFRRASVNPEHSWFESRRMAIALRTNSSLVALTFKPILTGKLPSFTVMCKFENLRGAQFSLGFWKCDLIQGDYRNLLENVDDRERIVTYLSAFDGISCPDNRPPEATKILLT
jgi:hypothetical protein